MRFLIVNLFLVAIILLGLGFEFWFKYLFFISFLVIVLIIDRHFIIGLVASLLVGIVYASLFSQTYFLIVFLLSAIIAKAVFDLFDNKLLSDISAGVISLFVFYSFLYIGFLWINMDYLASGVHSSAFIYRFFFISAFWWIIVKVIIFAFEKYLIKIPHPKSISPNRR